MASLKKASIKYAVDTMEKEELFELGSYINNMECDICNCKLLNHKKCKECGKINCKILMAMNNYTTDYHCMKCLSKNLSTFSFYYVKNYDIGELTNSIAFSYGDNKYIIYLNDIDFVITIPLNGKGNYYAYLSHSLENNINLIKKYKKYLKNYNEKIYDNDYRDNYEMSCIYDTVRRYKRENKKLLRLINEAKK